MKVEELVESVESQQKAALHGFLGMVGDVASHGGEESKYIKYALPKLQKAKSLGVSAEQAGQVIKNSLSATMGWTVNDVKQINKLGQRVFGKPLIVGSVDLPND